MGWKWKLIFPGHSGCPAGFLIGLASYSLFFQGEVCSSFLTLACFDWDVAIREFEHQIKAQTFNGDFFLL